MNPHKQFIFLTTCHLHWKEKYIFKTKRNKPVLKRLCIINYHFGSLYFPKKAHFETYKYIKLEMNLTCMVALVM